MLTWLTSLYTDWWRGDRTPAESEAATRPGDDTDGADDGNSTGGNATDGSVTREDDAPTSWRGLLDGEEVSKQEVQVELGLQPHEFLTWLVRDAGGRMWQADLVETTGWSKSTVSRYLDTLESDDVVERVRIGRRKLVGVPGEMPDAVPTADGPSVDPPSPETPTDSWTLETDERV